VTPGELRWVEFPPANGHEQSGRRPAIVLQDDTYARDVSVVFVIPVTGQPANLRFPATVALQPSDANGLRKPSVALVFQARAIDRKRVGNRIGVIEGPLLAEVYDALDRLTGRNRLPPTSAPPATPSPPPVPPSPTSPSTEKRPRKRRTIRPIDTDDL
jgi:mRNA interferase MazF